MKKRLSFLVFVLLSCSVLAEDWVNSESLEMDVKLSSGMTIVPTSSDYFVEHIITELGYYPKDTDFQEVLSMQTRPFAQENDDVLLFRWDEPKDLRLEYSVDAMVRSYYDSNKVRSKVLFPKEYFEFIQPTDNIDSDDPIIVAAANEIAAGSDDQFQVVFDISEWIVDNIDYDLNTLTADISQSASWVMRNRAGVCDEITSLFIAMCRSLGIPARFVSGLAYTNYQDLNNWGPHAWAEVYFEGVGWVPYDITYKQMGLIDPTHIVLSYSEDSDESSAKFKWKSRDVELKSEALDMKVILAKQGDLANALSDIKVSVLKNDVGFDSYNLIEASIENLQDYYLVETVQIARVDAMEILSEELQRVMLKPGQKKTVSWIIHMNPEVREGIYAYTIPVEVSNQLLEVSTSFRSLNNGHNYDLSEIEAIQELQKEGEDKIYSKKLGLECNFDKSEYYVYEQPYLNCTVTNQGNIFLESLNVCAETCKMVNLGISKSVSLEYSISAESKDLTVTATNNEAAKTITVPLNVIDEPLINISFKNVPNTVKYGDEFDLEILATKISESYPQGVVVELDGALIDEKWSLENFGDVQRFVISMTGRDLGIGVNDFNVLVSYKDLHGKEYLSQESFKIELVDVSVFQRIIIFFNKIAAWV